MKLCSQREPPSTPSLAVEQVIRINQPFLRPPPSFQTGHMRAMKGWPCEMKRVPHPLESHMHLALNPCVMTSRHAFYWESYFLIDEINLYGSLPVHPNRTVVQIKGILAAVMQEIIMTISSCC